MNSPLFTPFITNLSNLFGKTDIFVHFLAGCINRVNRKARDCSVLYLNYEKCFSPNFPAIQVSKPRVCSQQFPLCSALHAREHGSNKKNASQSCALSMVRQLFHLKVIEAYTGVTKKKTSDEVSIQFWLLLVVNLNEVIPLNVSS